MKQAGYIEISQFNKDMNINCLTDKIIISSDCILKILDFNLGTQEFFDSVSTVVVDVIRGSSMMDIEKSLKLINDYFINLRCLKIINETCEWSLKQTTKILQNKKIKLHLAQNRYLISSNSFCITSETGYVVLYDCNNQCIAYFDTLRIKSSPDSHMTQGDFVIFYYDEIELSLHIEAV